MPPKELKPSSPTSIDDALDTQSSIYSVLLSDDEGTDIENDTAPDLPFHNVNALSNQSISSSSSSDSSEEQASVDARLSMEKEKLSPPPAALHQIEGKADVVRHPSSISTNWRKPLATTTVDSDKIIMEHDAPPSVNILSSSPYPESEKLSPSEHVERRNGKQRRNRANSIESFELKEAVRVSLEEQRQNDDVDPRVTWDANIEAACEALARQRGENESLDTFKRRHEALLRSEHHLRDVHVDEDGVLAQEMYERELEERATECEETEAAEKRREMEKRKEIIVQYLEREALRTHDKSAEIEQKRVAHLRASS
ncbi:hypothetical protein C8R44DRAFT_740834 [Mycena epipterygia]|nr:hypothetical protein C8R44DRAFT_740834 [Mycena epipterygia]